MAEAAELIFGKESDLDLEDNSDDEPLYHLGDNLRHFACDSSIENDLQPSDTWEHQLRGRGQGRVSRAGGWGRVSRAASAGGERGPQGDAG